MARGDTKDKNFRTLNYQLKIEVILHMGQVFFAGMFEPDPA
jgi:hypothetical protein